MSADEVKFVKVFELKGDQYMVKLEDEKTGEVSYLKLGKANADPYHVKLDADGRPTCGCQGFYHRASCRHTEHYVEVVWPLIESILSRETEEDETLIPREVAEAVLDGIRERLALVDVQVYTAGSFRRGREKLHDIDLVAPSSGGAAPIVEALQDLEPEIVAGGESVIRMNVGLEDPILVDISVTDEHRLGACLMYLTGSKEFNVAMRKRAKAKGMKLTRNGLFDRGTDAIIASETEEEIFKALGLEFIEPKDRYPENIVRHQRKREVAQ